MHLGYIITKLNNGLSFQITKLKESVIEYVRSIRSGNGYIESNVWLITVGSHANIDVNTSTITIPRVAVERSSRPCTVYGISTSFRNSVYNAVIIALDELIETAITDTEGNIITPVDGLPVGFDEFAVAIDGLASVPLVDITAVPHSSDTRYYSY